MNDPNTSRTSTWTSARGRFREGFTWHRCTTPSSRIYHSTRSTLHSNPSIPTKRDGIPKLWTYRKEEILPHVNSLHSSIPTESRSTWEDSFLEGKNTIQFNGYEPHGRYTSMHAIDLMRRLDLYHVRLMLVIWTNASLKPFRSHGSKISKDIDVTR